MRSPRQPRALCRIWRAAVSRTVLCANRLAGRQDCLLQRRIASTLNLGHDDDVACLEKGGPMLGAMSNGTFHTGTVTLDQGCVLIACSMELRSVKTRETKSSTQRGCWQRHAAGVGSASRTLFSALGAVLDFADGCPLSDDLTLLVVRRGETVVKSDRSDAGNSLSVTRGQVPVAPLRGARRQRLVS